MIKNINLIICILLSFVIFSCTSTNREKPKNNKQFKKVNHLTKKIYILPLGKSIPHKLLQKAIQSIKIFYGFEVQILPLKPLPKNTYYPPRKRYRADKLLDYLLTQLPKDGDFIAGITPIDISTTKGKYIDWGVIGLATLEGKSCMISTFRCRLKDRSNKHAPYRFSKAVVHEIGHNIGLSHCPNEGCLLNDAKGTYKTIDKEYTLCQDCKNIIKKLGYTIPNNPKPPWPKPNIKLTKRKKND